MSQFDVYNNIVTSTLAGADLVLSSPNTTLHVYYDIFYGNAAGPVQINAAASGTITLSDDIFDVPERHLHRQRERRHDRWRKQ